MHHRLERHDCRHKLQRAREVHAANRQQDSARRAKTVDVHLGQGERRLAHPACGVGAAAIVISYWRRAYDRIATLASQGAELIVLPEKMVGVTPESATSVINILGGAARAARVTVIAGISRDGLQPQHNIALPLR